MSVSLYIPPLIYQLSNILHLPTQVSPVTVLFPCILSWNTECDLDDLSLHLVAATARFLEA